MLKYENYGNPTDGKYTFRIEGLNTIQASELVETLEKWKTEENIGAGTMYLVPAGKYKGNTIEDVSNEIGIRPLVEILKSYPFVKLRPEDTSRETTKALVGANPHDAMDFIGELIPWLIDNLHEFSEDTLMSSFPEFITESIIRKIHGGNEYEKEKAIRMIADEITEKLIEISNEASAIQQRMKSLGNYTLMEGEYASMTLKEICVEKGYSALVRQMLKCKGIDFDKTKSYFKLILSFADAMISYEDFLKEFGVFFRITPEISDELLNKPEEEREKDFRDKVEELVARMEKK